MKLFLCHLTSSTRDEDLKNLKGNYFKRTINPQNSITVVLYSWCYSRGDSEVPPTRPEDGNHPGLDRVKFQSLTDKI